MNQEAESSPLASLNHPLVMVGIGIVAVALLLYMGWHTMQPAKYTPSPGAGGRPKVEAPYMKPGAPPPPRQ